jgi:hypothetical protein
MWRILVVVFLLAGCVQIPLSQQEIQARKFEAVAERAVIYLARDYPDFSDVPAAVYLDDSASVTIYAGTYYRWEAEPGRRRISGFGPDTGAITLDVQAGRIYYVQMRVVPLARFHQSHYRLVAEPHGRAVVARGRLAGGL